MNYIAVVVTDFYGSACYRVKVWLKVTNYIFRASKSTAENTIVFGQESDYTGPLGNTMKVVAQRNGDVITATAMGVDIKLEIVDGNAVESFTAKGKVWTRTSQKC